MASVEKHKSKWRGRYRDAAGRNRATKGFTSKRAALNAAQPSLDRQSVTEFAGEWAVTNQHRADRPRPVSAPPDDEEVWLDSATTALVLGISQSRLNQLALADRLPCVVRGKRRWFRRTHVD